jgi:hypothetical protein
MFDGILKTHCATVFWCHWSVLKGRGSKLLLASRKMTARVLGAPSRDLAHRSQMFSSICANQKISCGPSTVSASAAITAPLQSAQSGEPTLDPAIKVPKVITFSCSQVRRQSRQYRGGLFDRIVKAVFPGPKPGGGLCGIGATELLAPISAPVPKVFSLTLRRLIVLEIHSGTVFWCHSISANSAKSIISVVKIKSHFEIRVRRPL